MASRSIQGCFSECFLSAASISIAAGLRARTSARPRLLENLACRNELGKSIHLQRAIGHRNPPIASQQGLRRRQSQLPKWPRAPRKTPQTGIPFSGLAPSQQQAEEMPCGRSTGTWTAQRGLLQVRYGRGSHRLWVVGHRCEGTVCCMPPLRFPKLGVAPATRRLYGEREEQTTCGHDPRGHLFPPCRAAYARPPSQRTRWSWCTCARIPEK